LEQDIVVYVSQECTYDSVNKRFKEIQSYLVKQGFGVLSLEKPYVHIWQMFITVFVKPHLRQHISQVRSGYIMQGKFMGMPSGNKGCVAYGFKLRGKEFNFIGCHLKHGQDNQDVRNIKAAEILQGLEI
jgi:hypothetical protein